MSADQRRQAAEAFWRDEDGASERAEAIAAIAQRLKFRAKSVVVLPARFPLDVSDGRQLPFPAGRQTLGLEFWSGTLAVEGPGTRKLGTLAVEGPGALSIRPHRRA